MNCLDQVAEQYGLTPREAANALRQARADKISSLVRELKRRTPIAPITSGAQSTHTWCGQCERLVRHSEADRCRSRWCKGRIPLERELSA